MRSTFPSILLAAAALAVGCSDGTSTEPAREHAPQLSEECRQLETELEKLDVDASTIKVFLADDATPAELGALRLRLETINGVEAVEYVSKEDAYDRATELFRDSPGVMQNLSSNPFPASYEVRLARFEDARVVERRLGGRPGVSKVKVGGATSRKLLTALRAGDDVPCKQARRVHLPE